MAISSRDILFMMRAQDFASREIDRVTKAFAGTNAAMAMTAEKATQIRRLAMGGFGLAAGGTLIAAAGAQGLSTLTSLANEAAEFDTAIRYAATQTDDLAANIEPLGDIAHRVAGNFAVEAEGVRESMYDILSTIDVGMAGTAHLMEQGASAAVAGQTDMRTALEGTLAMMNAYKIPVSEVEQLLDKQFALVRYGKGEYEDFSKVLGRVAPIASANGQAIDTMFGALTFLTRGGVNAAESATSLRQAMIELFRHDTIENLEKMGIETQNARGEFRQLDDIIMDLMTKGGFAALKDAERRPAMEELFGREGRVRAKVFFDQLFERYADLDDITQRVTNSTGAMSDAYELMADSAGAKLQILTNNWQILKEEVGGDVLDAFIWVVDALRAAVQVFRDLDPELRKNIVHFVGIASVVMIAVGVVTALAGVFLILTSAIMTVWPAMSTLGAAMAIFKAGGILGAAIHGIILLVRNFDSLKAGISDFLKDASRSLSEFAGLMHRGIVLPVVNAVNGAMRGLEALAQGFATALSAVLQIVSNFGMAIYNALQRLNPFARFSPSLVDNVREGVNVIVAKYGELSAIIPALDGARNAVLRLKDAAQSLQAAADARTRAEMVEYLSLAGPQAVAAYAAAERALASLISEQESIIAVYQREAQVLKSLKSELDKVQVAYDKQEQVINRLRIQERDLSYELDKQERILGDVQKALRSAQDDYQKAESAVGDITRSISDAQRAMEDFASAPLAGASEYEDKMHDLEMQALAVEKEMAKWKAAGAPPEAMDFFNLQLDEIQGKMDKLRLDREIETKPLRKQLEDLANTQKELTFEEAREGILKAQEQIKSLQDSLPSANAELQKQTDIVAVLQEQYDLQRAAVEVYREQVDAVTEQIAKEEQTLSLIGDKLDVVSDKYSAQEQAVRELESAYNDLGSEISSLQDEMQRMVDLGKEQADAIEAAKKAAKSKEEGGFDISGLPSVEAGMPTTSLDDLPDYSSIIDDMDTSALDDMTESINGLADKINKAYDAFNKFAGPVLIAVGALKLLGKYFFGTASIRAGIEALWIGLKVAGGYILKLLAPALSTLAGVLGTITAPVWAVIAVVAALVAGFVYLWNTNEDFRKKVIDIWEAIKGFFVGVKDWFLNTFVPAIVTAWGNIKDGIAAVKNWFTNTLIPGLQSVWDTIVNAVRVMRDTFAPIIEGMKIVFRNTWELISQTFESVIGVVTGVFQGFIALFKGDWSGLWEAVKKVFNSAWDFIVQLFETMIVNAVAIIVGFAATVRNIWTRLWPWVKEKLKNFKDWAIDAFIDFRDSVVAKLRDLRDRAVDLAIRFRDAVVAKFRELRDRAIEAAKELFNNVVDWFRQLPEKIMSFITGLPEKLYNWGKNVLDRAKAGIIYGWGLLRNWLIGLPVLIMNLIRTLPEKLYDFGVDMLEGLKNGIIDTIGKVTDAVRDVATEVKDTVTNLWKLRSPSKVAHYFGEMFGMGLVGGLENLHSDVVQEAINITKDAVKALDVDATQNPTMGLGSPLPVGQGTRSTTGGVNVTIENGAFTVTVEGNADDNTVAEIEQRLDEFMTNLVDEIRTGSKGTT